MSSDEQIRDKITELKERRNAVLLVHNYQIPEVQEVADFLGDSLGLSRKAAETDADVIVFCGVKFMAETAAILSPDKKVIMPDPAAGCPMADMIERDELRALKEQHPDAVVVCYVNSSAEVKAESDLCCTSANAKNIVESVEDDRPIIFVPDKYLGSWTALQAGRELGKDFILWDGYCPTHARITPADVQRARAEHPDALLMVHPECLTEVCRMADAVESTSGMCRLASESDAEEFIVGTEKGMVFRLATDNPGKQFYHISSAAICPNMKLNNLEKVLWSLQEMEHEINVPTGVADKARRSIEAMVQAHQTPNTG
jgi:quinolinate synthase